MRRVTARLVKSCRYRGDLLLVGGDDLLKDIDAVVVEVLVSLIGEFF